MQPAPLTLNGWNLLARIPEGPGPHPAILLTHGWKGDERVMWIFAEKIPAHWLVVAPRGLYPAPGGEGYGWASHRPEEGLSNLEHFTPSVDALAALLDALPAHLPGDFRKVHLMGFSQGAALAYCFAAFNPHRVHSAAGLAGFVPEGLEDLAPYQPLQGLPLYIAHGTGDKTIPIDQGRRAITTLTRLGAVTHYCEASVGHKMSAGCLKGLRAFYQQFTP